MDEEEQKQRFRHGYVRMVAIFLAMLAVPLILYSLWDKYYSPQSQDNSAVVNAERYQAATKAYEDAMRTDTYGGKTPEETLQMLISALKAGDIDLAAKYFELEQNPNDPNYLTRKKWEDALAQAKSEGKLESVVSTLGKAQPSMQKTSSPDTVEYVVLGQGKIVDYSIYFARDTYSDTWKIENL